MARRDDMGTHQTMARHDQSERHALSRHTRGRPFEPLHREDLTEDRHGLDRCTNKTPFIHVSPTPQSPTSPMCSTTPPDYRWLPLTQGLDKNGARPQEQAFLKSIEAPSQVEARGKGYRASSTESPRQGRLEHMLLEVSSTTTSRTRSKSATSLRLTGIGRSRSATSTTRSALSTTFVSDKIHTRSADLVIRARTPDTIASSVTEGHSSDNIIRLIDRPTQPTLPNTDCQPQQSPIEVQTWATAQSDHALANPGSMHRRSRTVHSALTTADFAFPAPDEWKNTRPARIPLDTTHPHPCCQHDNNQSSSSVTESAVDSEPAHTESNCPQMGRTPSGSASLGGSFGFTSRDAFKYRSSELGNKRKGSEPPDDRPTKVPIPKPKKRKQRVLFHCVFCSSSHRNDVTDDCKTKKAYVSQLRRHHERHDFYYCTTCFRKFSTLAARDAHDQTEDCAFRCVKEECPRYRQVSTALGESCEHGKTNSPRDQWRELFRLARPGEYVPDPLFDTDDGSTRPRSGRRASAVPFARDTARPGIPSISPQEFDQERPSNNASPNSAVADIQELARNGRDITNIAETLEENEASMEPATRQSLYWISRRATLLLQELHQLRDSMSVPEVHATNSSASTTDGPRALSVPSGPVITSGEPSLQTGYDTAQPAFAQAFIGFGSHLGDSTVAGAAPTGPQPTNSWPNVSFTSATSVFNQPGVYEDPQPPQPNQFEFMDDEVDNADGWFPPQGWRGPGR